MLSLEEEMQMSIAKLLSELRMKYGNTNEKLMKIESILTTEY